MALNVETWAEVADMLHTEHHFSAHQTVVETFAKLWTSASRILDDRWGCSRAVGELLLTTAVLNRDDIFLHAVLSRFSFDDAFLIKLRGKAKQLGHTKQVIQLSLTCSNEQQQISGLIEAVKHGEYDTVRLHYFDFKPSSLVVVFQHIILVNEKCLATDFEAYHVPHTYEVIAQAIRDGAGRQLPVCSSLVLWFLRSARLSTLNNLRKVCNEEDRTALTALADELYGA